MQSEDFTNLPIPETLLEATRLYADLDFCTRFLASLRWKGEPICQHCGGIGASYISTRRIFKCKQCRKQYSVKAGTVFEDSPIGLDKWLVAMWMLANCKNGMSSYELGRNLGVTQKTAWFMLHRLRVVMRTGTFAKFSGEVEADESFVGGKAKNMHHEKKKRVIGDGRGSVGKTIVMGILERGTEYKDKYGDTKKTKSRVHANVVKDTSAAVLHNEIKSAVAPGANLYTDAHRGYRGLNEFYKHQWVDHAVKYVEGRVYTNGMENFWCLLDRTIDGTYVSVEPEHLLAYVDEQAFRFNERGGKDADRFVKALGQVGGKRLTYHSLIGSPCGIESADPLRGGPRAD